MEFQFAEEIHEVCLGFEFYYGINKIAPVQRVFTYILFTMRATGNIFRKKIVFYENALSFLALLIINRKYHDIKIQPHLLIQAKLKSKRNSLCYTLQGFYVSNV